jgi:hypothetical protein
VALLFWLDFELPFQCGSDLGRVKENASAHLHEWDDSLGLPALKGAGARPRFNVRENGFEAFGGVGEFGFVLHVSYELGLTDNLRLNYLRPNARAKCYFTFQRHRKAS